MCIFSGEVESVSATKIFARMLPPDAKSTEAIQQVLVYQMTLSAGQPVAMILPLPVERVDGEVKEDALTFISLEKYPSFFADMESGFPQPRSRSTDSLGDSFRSKGILQVHQVGAFVASFVPTVEDFDRLDPKFRLPAGAVSYPGYKDFSFAVFQIKPGRQQDIHPMAFTFPNRDANILFFPTVHVHDGEAVKAKDHFDHSLYCQHPHHDFDVQTSEVAARFMKIALTRGLVSEDWPIGKRVIQGMHPNEDIVIAA